VVTFVVEAYLAGSQRLLWRSTEAERSTAYWLALRADADPRLEVRVREVRGEATDPPPPAIAPRVTPRSAPTTRGDARRLWLVCEPST
jgi:hypothetical protein